MKIDGGCHCGALAYEAEIDLETVTVCHCDDCQSLSGSAFRTAALTVPGGFRFTKGTPKIYVKKTAQSGRAREQAFCGTCGSPIFSAPVGDGPKVYGIRLGTANQRRELIPRSEKFCASRLEWLPSLPDVERVAGDG